MGAGAPLDDQADRLMSDNPTPTPGRCPFCGSRNIELDFGNEGDLGRWFECHECEARARISIWNQRARGTEVLNIHCIPVGNGEPIHECHTLCWCHPVKDPESKNLYAHNAKDCREKWERQGLDMPAQSLWVTVGEKLNA